MAVAAAAERRRGGVAARGLRTARDGGGRGRARDRDRGRGRRRGRGRARRGAHRAGRRGAAEDVLADGGLVGLIVGGGLVTNVRLGERSRSGGGDDGGSTKPKPAANTTKSRKEAEKAENRHPKIQAQKAEEIKAEKRHPKTQAPNPPVNNNKQTTINKRKDKRQNNTHRRRTLRARRIRRWRALGVLGPLPVQRQGLVLVLGEARGTGGTARGVGLRPDLPLAAGGAERAQGKGLARGGRGAEAEPAAKGAQGGEGGGTAPVRGVLSGVSSGGKCCSARGCGENCEGGEGVGGKGGKQQQRWWLTRVAMTEEADEREKARPEADGKARGGIGVKV